MAASGPIGEGSFTARLETGELRDTSVFGYELGGPGLSDDPERGRLPNGDGEAVASSSDASAGYGIGQTVTVVPGDTPVTIVGLADDVQFNVQPTLFVSFATYEQLVTATNPDAIGVLAEPRRRRARLGRRSDDARDDDHRPGPAASRRSIATPPLRRLPGVSSIQQSFAIILGLAFVVVILLTGLLLPDHHGAEDVLAHAAPRGGGEQRLPRSGTCSCRC